MNNQPLSIRRTVMDLPIPQKLTLIIGLFSVVICGLLLVSYLGMEILSGSRAYVGGEGLWSKAQKGAVYRLTRYALFHDETDYQKYLDHIGILLGDHQARMELAKPQLNYSVVFQGFVQGRNHPADVRTMTLMARKLHAFRYMNRALAIWAEADGYVEKLQSIGTELHREIASGRPSPQRIKDLFEKIQTIDAQLTPLEDEFSYTLGEGARWLKGLLLAVMILTTCLFLAATLLVAFWISKHLCEEIDQLHQGASRIAGGDYSISLNVASKDEIGDLARTFQEMAAQRQQAEQLKDEFFANVSHELRTPLTLILSPLESVLAQDHGGSDSLLRPALQTMHNNAIRLLQLVNGLLDFSKLEAGQLQARREPVRIADLVDMVFKDFQPLINQKGLQADLYISSHDTLVMMDRYLYERILFNLLSNAVKFTARDGRVDVRLDWTKERLTLMVSDTGIGIPTHEIKNVFQRFRQVEGSSTRRFEGTGLGLALVKEFASLLEGTVSVESDVGKGSVFTVVCSAPCTDSAPATDLKPVAGSVHAQQYAPAFSTLPAPGPSSETLPRVLIAEDNAEMASYIASLVASFCQSRVARDGKEALEQIQGWSPDLILTDVMMPERDGLSLCRQVKSNPVTSSIPVVVLTALTHREALIEGWKAGANEYLFKPFHPMELITRVQSLLKAHQEQQQAEERIAQLNQKLRRHALDLEATNQELEAFSYSVSHDLRAPLRAIDGFSKELLINCEQHLKDRDKQDLQRIRAATLRMSQLIDDLLELAHLSRLELRSETVNLSATAERIIDELRQTDPRRQVDCVIIPHVTTKGDGRLLHIALDNLIQNAWKFTQKQPLAKIEFGVLDQEGKRVYFLRDNGVGFNMAYAAKLFKAFQRLHDAKDFPGTGIGLALVQRIVHRHGGEIWAAAEEDRGATFYFTLPAPVTDKPSRTLRHTERATA